MTAIITVMPEKPPMNVSMRRIQINVVNLLSQEHEFNFKHVYHPNILDEEGHMIWVDNPDGKINKHNGKVEQNILTDKTKMSVRTYGKNQRFKELLEVRIRKLLMSYFNPLDKTIEGFTIELAVSALVSDKPMYKDEIDTIVIYNTNARTFTPFNDPQHKTILTKTPPPPSE